MNDGFAVALFVFVKGVIVNGVGGNILIVLIKEIFGAIIVGLLVSYVLHKLLRKTNNPILHILISLLDVSLSYVICDDFGFSGVISSVVCGMYFSYQDKKIERWKEVVDSKELYSDFWNIMENLLNSMLFVLVGFSILSMKMSSLILVFVPIAIILNLLSRYTGVRVATLLIGNKNIPSKYDANEFSLLLTWSGLKGGLSLALALTTKAILPIESYEIILNIIMITILFTTIVQGLIVGKMYKYIESKKEKRYTEKSLKLI